MSFTVEVKEEISSIKSTKSEIIAELSAYIRNNGTITNDKVTLQTENHFLVKRVIDELKTLYDIELEEKMTFYEKHKLRKSMTTKLALLN